MLSDNTDWKRKAVEGTPFTQEELEAETSKLQILVFRLDGRGENVVSSIDGTIVFVDRWYSGEKVNAGDIWLCSVRYTGKVYHAMPMKKITVDMIMGMSEGLRNDIVDALWNTNRKDYERLFEERYKTEIHNQVLEEANKENRQIVSRMQARIDTLMKQVEQTNYLLMNSEGDDEIILTSDIEEPIISYTSQMPSYPVTDDVQRMQAIHSYDDSLFSQSHSHLPKAERISADTIYCEAIADGRCKVLISPDYKTLVVTKCSSGMVICSKSRITLKGLERVSPFTERKKLFVEQLDECSLSISL